LRHLAFKRKIPIVDGPQEADFVLVSVCDIKEIEKVFAAKKYGKPIVAGGMISEFPILNEASDFVWHGEAYGFFDYVKNGGTIIDMGSPHLTNKRNRRLNINQDIRWTENPIINVGTRAAYYYVGKGCPYKCKFCYMSYAREFQVISENLYFKAERSCRKPFMLMPIASFNPYWPRIKRQIVEIPVREYLKHPLKAKLIRFGVEFAESENSRNLAKGVDVSLFDMAIEKARIEKSKMIVYFIGGVESDEKIIDFFGRLRQEYTSKPSVMINFTYLDPPPFTPFYDFNLSILKKINERKILNFVQSHNKRFRIHYLPPILNALKRTMVTRAISIEDYNIIKKQANVDDLFRSLPHLIGKSDLKIIKKRSRESTTTFMPYWEH
jgi:hypothetical protein